MTVGRRGFVEGALSIAALPVLGSILGKQSLGLTVDSQNEAIDPAVIQFWQDSVRRPSRKYRSGVVEMGGAPPPAPKASTFVYFDDTLGFVPAGTIKPTDIHQFPQSGDVTLEVHVERFKPSISDAATLNSLQTGTLRIDVQQAKPLPDLAEALAWTAMGTLVSKNKSAPTITALKFDPGSAWGNFQNIPLTGGLGFWSWNFFMKRQQGFFGSFLSEALELDDKAQSYLPLLGIPGIAVSGLKYIDQILGAVQAQGSSQWLFQGLDTAICATRDGYDLAGGDGAAKLVLTSGNYLVIHEEDVSKLSGLVLQDGLVVPKGTDKLKIFDVACSGPLAELTYLTVSSKVTQKKVPDGTTKQT